MIVEILLLGFLYLTLSVFPLIQAFSLPQLLHQILSVLVHLQLDETAIAGVDRDSVGLPVLLVAHYLFYVDPELLPINLRNLPLVALLVPSDDQHFVVSPYRKTPDSMLSPQLRGKIGTHKLLSEMGWRVEMCPSVLPSMR